EITGVAEGIVTTKRGEGRRAKSGAPRRVLELELVDVLDVERVRRSEDDLRLAVRAPDDHVVAEFPGLEGMTDLAGDRAVGKRGDRVAGEVPEVLGVPELERRHRAVVHVRLHLARQTEACEDDLLLVLRVREVLRGRGDTDRR